MAFCGQIRRQFWGRGNDVLQLLISIIIGRATWSFDLSLSRCLAISWLSSLRRLASSFCGGIGRVQSFRSESWPSLVSARFVGVSPTATFVSCKSNSRVSSSLDGFFVLFLNRLPKTLFFRPFLSLSFSRGSKSPIDSLAELTESDRLRSTSLSRSPPFNLVTEV